MTMTGNFEAVKEHVRGEMQRVQESINADEVLSPSLKNWPSRSALSLSLVTVPAWFHGLDRS